MDPRIIKRWGTDYGFSWEGLYEHLWWANKEANSSGDWMAFNLSNYKTTPIDNWLAGKELYNLFSSYDKEQLVIPTKEYQDYALTLEYMSLNDNEIIILNFINDVLKTKFHLVNYDAGIEVTHIDSSSFISGVF